MPSSLRRSPYAVLVAATLAATPALAQEFVVMGDRSALERAASALDPGLRLPDNAALLQAADFTGDGELDVGAILHAGSRSALVVFHATPTGYHAHPLYTTLPPGEVAIRVVAPGRHRVLGPEGTIELTSPALELIFSGRTSALYVWSGDRYAVYPTESYF
ncbi:MAG: hypothetical protein ABR559_02270 [Gemmatimonadota bacterium]